LREVAHALATAKPGLYFLTSDLAEKMLFLCHASDELAKTINLKDLQTLLKDNYGLRGGGNVQTFQGGGDKIDVAVISKAIKSWLT